MDSEQFRKFKHELRTPVNHILGYSELLLETASDAGDRTAADLARNIQGCGQTLARLMEKNLLSLISSIDDDQMAVLRETVLPVVEQIFRASTDDPELVKAVAYADDFARIRQAATHLMTLIG